MVSSTLADHTVWCALNSNWIDQHRPNTKQKKLIPIVFHANSQQKNFASFYFKASFITSFEEIFHFQTKTNNLFFFTFCVFLFMVDSTILFFLIEILQIRLAGEFHAHSHTHLHLHSQQQQEAGGFQLPREFVFELKLKRIFWFLLYLRLTHSVLLHHLMKIVFCLNLLEKYVEGSLTKDRFN